ncbi:MAG: serine hydrolase domain-containing protein, partial [Eubacteriales bacterium]
MSTAKAPQNWFSARTEDRVQQYFENPNPARKPGERFEYDSSGTFVLGALVERLTGKRLMDYLREKLFDKIGISDRPYALYCPGGHTWSDSAFLMPPRDLFRAARFVLNGGSWDGDSLLSADYVKDAVSALISTGDKTHVDGQGYGYYIWKAYGEGFFFNGMGCQFALCVPEKDLIFICNADNQGNPDAKDIILDGFYDCIVRNTGEPLPENPAAQKALAETAASLKLFAAYGDADSPLASAVSGKRYLLSDNPMGIRWITISIDGKRGVMRYENEQGEKALPFGMCENVFADFPQEGYADRIGSVPGGRLYHGAYSAAWKDARSLWLKVQIIDDYFGNMDAAFTFSQDASSLDLTMTKTAEDFLNEYTGAAHGTADPV